MRILFFGSDFPLIKQGSAPVKIQKRENFSLLFVQRVDKVLNFLYNKGGKDRKLHKLCCRYAVCFRYFCDVSYPQLRELKHRRVIRPNRENRCILPAVAGIETSRARAACPTQRCILPAVAGIETTLASPTQTPIKKCILPAVAGIETIVVSTIGIVHIYVSYPQLRELKRGQKISYSFQHMYLTRNCGN